jgi:hypothetical protein
MVAGDGRYDIVEEWLTIRRKLLKRIARRVMANVYALFTEKYTELGTGKMNITDIL